MSTPTLTDIIKDYRIKARDFNTIADTLERDYGLKGDAGAFDAYHAPEENPVPIDNIKTFIIEKRAARASTISTALKTTKEYINKIVDENPTIFERADKGWIKVKSI